MTAQDRAKVEATVTRMVEAVFVSNLHDTDPLEVSVKGIYQEIKSDPFVKFDGQAKSQQSGEHKFEGNLDLSSGKNRRGELVLRFAGRDIYFPFNFNPTKTV